jgi:DNA-binding transcriptional LysR family regulator
MELYQLRTFAAVAEEGHLTRAAERLHISQPAVSGQIKALEREFEVRLFERSASGMTLTPTGREILVYARKVLASAADLQRAVKRLNGDVSGTLRIGTVSDPDLIRIGALLGHAVGRYPHLELELQHEVSGAALEAVREGSLDASFYFGDQPSAEFKALPLRQFVYRVAAPAAWADRVQTADWADVAAMPWVLTPEISTHNRLVKKLFAEHGVEPPQSQVEADQESVIASLVVSGVGLSLMREEIAAERERAGDICVWDRARLRTTLWFVCAAERADDPLLRALFALVSETWQLGAAAHARTPRTRESFDNVAAS